MIQPTAYVSASPDSLVRTTLKRLGRVRFYWFLIGSFFGVVSTSALNLLLSALLSVPLSGSVPGPKAQQEIAQHREQTEELAALPEIASAPAAEGDAYPLDLSLKVEKGDTLISLLTGQDVAYDEAYEAVQAIRGSYNPRNLKIGQEVQVKLSQSEQNPTKASIASLAIALSNVATVELVRQEDGSFEAVKKEKPLTESLARAGGIINSSLFRTGVENGIPREMLGEIIKAFSYDVDFQRDIQRGDRIDVVFETRETEEGIVADLGKLVYAQLTLSGKPLTIFRFKDGSGDWGYFNGKGESIVKALLRTPVNGARISSGFGMRRHPVLGYSKMHRGVDFAAPTGTPIYAAGDGVIETRGWVRGYGNYIKIRHNGSYATAYGHISRFARGIARGSRVKQGDVIAYVGSTGMSTGPHLHYEVHKNGVQVNPAAEQFQTGKVLAGADLQRFKNKLSELEQNMADITAMADKLTASR